MGNLLWEQQAVSQNLALLRSHLDMLDRELPANNESQQPKNQRGRATLVEEQGREERRVGVQRRREEESSHEIRVLRSRLRELESMVGVMDGRGREEVGLVESLEVDRNLAMLTAQYEKAGADCDLEDELNCSLPSGLAVPPPMEQLNNASRVEESVRLARELRARKEQLERLVQKNTFPSNCNELPGEPRREGGRRKETNVAGGQYGVTSGGSQYGVSAGGQFGGTTGGGQFSASQQLIRLQHQVRSFHPVFTSHFSCFLSKVTKLSGELDRLSGLPVPHPVLQGSHAGPTSTANTVSPQPQLRRNQGCCAAQLQTLSLSLNQVYAALWGLQREMARTSERVAALEEGGQVSSRQGRPASRESLMSSVTRREEWPAAGGEVIWPGVGGTEQSFSAPSFQHMSSPSRQNSGAEWGGSVPTWPAHPPTLPPDHHLSPFPSRDLWNSLQASPGFSPLHPSSIHPPPSLHPSLSLFPGAFPQERDSGVSSGALNNQVEVL